MTSRKEFTQFLWDSLLHKEYVWLNPGLHLSSEDAIPDILIPAIEVQALLTQMRQYPGVVTCQAAFRFHRTIAIFSFDQWSYSINFVHKMVSSNLFFLAENEVLAHKVRQLEEDAINIPCIEHLLEYTVLNAFLNRRGISEEDYRFLLEFHILVQEDLIEFFNEKYGTRFKDIYSLVEYRREIKNKLVQRLKDMPINGLAKIIPIHWYNFWGNLRREARMI